MPDAAPFEPLLGDGVALGGGEALGLGPVAVCVGWVAVVGGVAAGVVLGEAGVVWAGAGVVVVELGAEVLPGLVWFELPLVAAPPKKVVCSPLPVTDCPASASDTV